MKSHTLPTITENMVGICQTMIDPPKTVTEMWRFLITLLISPFSHT